MFNPRQLDTQAAVFKYTRRTVPWQPVVVFTPRCDGSYWSGSTDGQLTESYIHSCLYRTPRAAPPTLRLMAAVVSLSPAEPTGCQRCSNSAKRDAAFAWKTLKRMFRV